MDLYDKIYDLILEGKLNQAIDACKKALEELPENEFTPATKSSFSHLVDGLTQFLDSNFLDKPELERVKAFYAEMNGFSANWDEWYLHVFAYDKKESYHSESDWLCEEFWGSNSPEYFQITGLETIQKAFQVYDEADHASLAEYMEKAQEVTELLIVLRLQELFKIVIEQARLAHKEWAKRPWGVTAHEMEIILEIK